MSCLMFFHERCCLFGKQSSISSYMRKNAGCGINNKSVEQSFLISINHIHINIEMIYLFYLKISCIFLANFHVLRLKLEVWGKRKKVKFIYKCHYKNTQNELKT